MNTLSQHLSALRRGELHLAVALLEQLRDRALRAVGLCRAAELDGCERYLQQVTDRLEGERQKVGATEKRLEEAELLLRGPYPDDDRVLHVFPGGVLRLTPAQLAHLKAGAHTTLVCEHLTGAKIALETVDTWLEIIERGPHE